jgi:hypothetical protein
MVQDLQRFTATEKIEHSELRKDGRPRKKINAQFSYVAEIERNPFGGFWVYEYRTATASDPSPLVDTGTATYALIFHPSIVGNFEIRCEGQSEVQGAPAWQLRFEESPDPRKSFSAMLVRNNEYRVRFKGRAWIAADNYEVLRMQTDLVTPLPEIQLEVEHFDISYAPVEFANHKYRVWLPERASMHLSYRGRRYQRVHTFSHFQLFLVETDQKVKEPVASSGNRQ